MIGDELTAPNNAIQRIATGIAGLDTILGGGFLQGGTYLFIGVPGVGKTVIGNHICFQHVQAGGRAAYITMLGAEHARLLSYLQTFQFFQPEIVGAGLSYLSGYGNLQKKGLTGLRELLQRAIRTHKATLLVVDGVSSIEAFAESKLSFQEFIRDLQVYASAATCTLLFLGNGNALDSEPEQSLVDGLVELRQTNRNQAPHRELEVHKFRGGKTLKGSHFFTIDAAGVTVYPNFETLYAMPTRLPPASHHQLTTGIPGLDHMVGGGLPHASTTLLLGPPGSGKSLIGAAFLVAGAQERQPGLLFGFNAPPQKLAYQANQVGLDITPPIQQGMIEVLWQPPINQHLDVLAHRLLAAVQRRQVRRLVINGLEGFQQAAPTTNLDTFLITLSNELRGLGVTILLTMESNQVLASTTQIPLQHISASIDNILILHHLARGPHLRRCISVLKSAAGRHLEEIAHLRLTPHGIEIEP